MKFLKKLTLLLTLAVSVFALTACSANTLAVNGYLWFNDPSVFNPNFVETSVYDVSFVNQTPSNSTKVEVEGYSLNVKSGVYTTVLKSFRNPQGLGDYYEYTTSFTLVADYVVPNPENGVYEVIEESFATKTIFKSDLTPITSEKSYQSSMSNYKYSYVIEYSGSTATASLRESTLEDKNVNEQTFTFKKYNKKAYIDNDILLLTQRLFNIDGSFTRSFKTVDVLSNKLHKMNSYAYLRDKNLDVKDLENYVLNGVDLKMAEPTVSCAHVQIAIADTFAGAPIECYYAQDRNTHRHRLIETYTTFGSLGYLKFHLSNVTITE